MYVERHDIELNTGTGTTAEGFTAGNVHGRVLSIQYSRATASQLAATAVLTVSTEKTGVTVWSEAAGGASIIRVPRQVVHTSAGAAATTALDGSGSPFFVGGERIKAAVAGGGTGKIGTIRILVG